MECFFQEKIYLCIRFATIAQLVEHWLPKPRVAGSSPVYRSKIIGCTNQCTLFFSPYTTTN